MTPITVFLISVVALSVVCGIAVVIAKGLYLISKWLESKHFKPFTAYMLPILVAAWVEDERRCLDTPFWVDDLQLMKPILLRDSPIAFRRRLIFTEAEPLRRGRFPVEAPGFTDSSF